MDGDQRLMLYWIDPVDAADRLAAKSELVNLFYLHYERQESEQRPERRANQGLVVPIQHWYFRRRSS